MKYINVLVLILIFPFSCCGSTVFDNVTLEDYVLAGDKKVILAIGDSITVGLGDTYTNPGGTWSDIGGFRDNLQDKTGNWSVFWGGDQRQANLLPYDQDRYYAFSGMTAQVITNSALADPAQHTTWIEPDSDSLIILLVGTNDAKVDGASGADETTEVATLSYIQNYVTTVDGDDSTIDIILCTLPPIDNANQNAWAESFNTRLASYVDGSAKTNLYLVDLHTALDSCWGVSCNDDTYHPNAEGYEIIAQTIYSKILEEGLL